MECLAGPSLDMSFHDIGFDAMGSSPAIPSSVQRGRHMRFDLGYPEEDETSGIASPSTQDSGSSSRTTSTLSDTETDVDGQDGQGDGESDWTSDDSEAYGVFFGKKTEREQQYLRSLAPFTPPKTQPSASLPASAPGSAPRIVRKRDSREFHRRRTMVFSKKDRMSLSVQAGNREGSSWDVQDAALERREHQRLEAREEPDSQESAAPIQPETEANRSGHAREGEGEQDTAAPGPSEKEAVEGGTYSSEAATEREAEQGPALSVVETPVREEEGQIIDASLAVPQDSDNELRESALPAALEQHDGRESGPSNSKRASNRSIREGPTVVHTDDSIASETVDLAAETSTSTSDSSRSTANTEENDSPLPISRAVQYMSPRSHMRGDFFASPSLARDDVGGHAALLSPLEQKQAAPLVLSPIQDDSEQLRLPNRPSLSPLKRTAGASSMTDNATPVRPAAKVAHTPMGVARGVNPLSGMLSSQSHQTPMQAVTAAPQARKVLVKNLAPPPPSVSKPNGDVLGSRAFAERERKLTSQLDAALLRMDKTVATPSPAIRRALVVPRPVAAAARKELSPAVPMLGRAAASPAPQQATAEVFTDAPIPAAQTSATSPSVSKLMSKARAANAGTPQQGAIRRTGLPTFNKLNRRSPTPTDLGSSMGTPGRIGTPGRLGPPVRPGVAGAPGSAVRNPSRLGRPLLPGRPTALKPNSSLPPATRPGTIVGRTQPSMLSVARSATAPSLGHNLGSGRSVYSQSTTSAVSRPSRLGGPVRGGPLRRNGTRPVPAPTAKIGPPTAAVSPAPPALSVPTSALASTSAVQPEVLPYPAPINNSDPPTPKVVEQPVVPAVPVIPVIASPPRPDSTTPTTSPTSAEIAPLRALAGRTPALRREKGALKSQAAIASMARSASSSREGSIEVGSSAQVQPAAPQAASTETDTAQAHAETAASGVAIPSVSAESIAPAATAAAAVARPVRARQRSLAAREPPTNKRSLASRSASAPPPSTSQVSRFPIPDKDLQAVTKRNTMRNEVYFCAITRNIVRRDGPRPPSPTSKIRTVADREEEDRRINREARAKRRDRCKSGDESEEDEPSRPPTPIKLLKHLRGPGDEEDYETPARAGKRGRKSQIASNSSGSPATKGVRRKRSRPDVGPAGKSVRWDKGLVLLADGQRGPPAPDASEVAELKSCLTAKSKVNLDHLGNVTNPHQTLPDVKRSRITVAVILYDGEQPTEPVVPSGKGKGK